MRLWLQLSRHLFPSLISEAPATCRTYQPLPFLTNCHVETIFAAKTRIVPQLKYQREVVMMPDGGCVSLDYEMPILDQQVWQ